MTKNLKLRDGGSWLNLTPIYGLGFPNGVVSASVGSIYIDTNVTNGASSWIKKSGTGNTGWQVLEGDTGWRVLTMGAHWTGGTFRTRRVNSTVFVQIYTVYVAAAPTGTRASARSFLDGAMPSGFVRTSWWGFGGSGISSGIRVNNFPCLTINMSGASDFGVRVLDGVAFGNWTEGDSLSGDMSYCSDDAWPTTLPGTPA